MSSFGDTEPRRGDRVHPCYGLRMATSFAHRLDEAAMLVAIDARVCIGGARAMLGTLFTGVGIT